MCGIVGIYHRDGAPVDLEALVRMNDAIVHRGPDGEGYVLLDPAKPGKARFHPRPSLGLPSAPLALANRRLSIIDLSDRGAQPMCNEDGSLWVVFNGEIYNHLELAEELKGRGHVFRSRCDTEVILHAFEEWDDACLQRFNGMWAFALWDGRAGRLFCARDRFGIKPFYYFDDGRRFLFASEIKSLLLHPAVPRKAHGPTIYRYLATGSGLMDFTDATFFGDIRQIPPSHFLQVRDGRTEVRRYWEIERATNGDFPKTDAEAAEGFRALFREAVRLRLRSDVPLGVCLSGGLDSSSIACVAAREIVGSRLRTFSSCFEDPRYDERKFIHPVVEHTGAQARYVFPRVDELFDLLPDLIWFQDEPFHNLNQFAQWYVMRAVRAQDVKVVLSGHGGDELLNGYPQDFVYHFADLLGSGRWGNLLREVKAYRQAGWGQGGRAVAAAVRVLAGLRAPEGLKRRLKRNGAGFHGVLDPHFVRENGEPETMRLRGGSNLRTCSYLGLRLYPVPGWLHFEDRNSMAFSVESRIPFLDHRLVEYAYALPGEQKIRDGRTKVVLRNAMRGILPEVIRARPDKKGFLAPTDLWLKTEIRKTAQDLFQSQEFRSRGYFNPEAVLREYGRHCRGEQNIRLALWSWINLELWFRRMIDGPITPAPTPAATV
ncbi:MAG: asparagine synthase (glutamine-hydrolyzing) [Nitrospinota bacterium]